MKKMLVILSALVITLGEISPSHSYWPDGLWLPPEQPGYLLEAYSQNFLTESNYTSQGGEYESLPQNGSFLASRNRITGAYTLLSGIQLRATADLTHAAVKTDSVEDSQTMFTGLEFGMIYPFFEGAYSLFWDVRAHLTLDPVGFGRNRPMAHDGVHFLQSHLRFRKKWNHLAFFTDQGIHYPAEGLATLWFWSLGTHLYLQRMTLSGLLQGFNTLAEDEFTADPVLRTRVTEDSNAGSLAFYSKNPQRLDFRVLAEIHLNNNWSLPLGFMKTLNGKSSAEGFEITAGLRWMLGKETNRKRPSPVRPVREEDFEIDRPANSKEEPVFGEDGELLQDTEELMEENFRKRK